MWKFYWGLLKKVPGTLSAAFDRWVSLATLVIFLLTLFNEPLGQTVEARWQGFSPWWSALPVGLLFFYGMMKANFESHRSLLQRLGPEPSQKAIDILLAAYEGLKNNYPGILVNRTMHLSYVLAGHTALYTQDPTEAAEYIAEIEPMCEGQWLTKPSWDNPDYYELAAKGLSKAKELFGSPEGTKRIADIHRKFDHK